VIRHACQAPAKPPPRRVTTQKFIFLLTSNNRRFTLSHEILLHDKAVNEITPPRICTLKAAFQYE
jgi:hypothetical protein